MNSRALATRAVALALVLGTAAGFTASQADNLQVTAVLVLAGAMTVGGIAPRRLWWLGGLVGAGVIVARLAAGDAPWVDSDIARHGREWFGSEWVGILAPLVVALAGGGLGASLGRLTSGSDPEA